LGATARTRNNPIPEAQGAQGGGVGTAGYMGKEKQVTTICCVCGGYISGTGNPISHGIHVHCGMMFYPGAQRPELLAQNPDPCTACGHLRTTRELYASEPKGYPVAYNHTSCAKRRGWCPRDGHFISMEDQEVIVCKVSDGKRTWEERHII